MASRRSLADHWHHWTCYPITLGRLPLEKSFPGEQLATILELIFADICRPNYHFQCFWKFTKFVVLNNERTDTKFAACRLRRDWRTSADDRRLSNGETCPSWDGNSECRLLARLMNRPLNGVYTGPVLRTSIYGVGNPIGFLSTLRI